MWRSTYKSTSSVRAIQRSSLSITLSRVAVIQTRLNEKEALAAFWTLASMSFGLMIASIISAAQNQLSFFNAFAVQNLVL